MTQHQPETGFYDADTCELADFAALTSRTLPHKDVPLAVEIAKNIPIYDGPALTTQAESPTAADGFLPNGRGYWGNPLVFSLSDKRTTTEPLIRHWDFQRHHRTGKGRWWGRGRPFCSGGCQRPDLECSAKALFGRA